MQIITLTDDDIFIDGATQAHLLVMTHAFLECPAHSC